MTPHPRTWMIELAVEAGLPYLTYLLLRSQGVSAVWALAAGAVFPAAFVVAGFARHRRLDGLGAIILATILVGVVLTVVSGDARFALVKESFVTGAFGLALLFSLLAPRPMMFYFGAKFATDGTPDGRARWDSIWPQSPT